MTISIRRRPDLAGQVGLAFALLLGLVAQTAGADSLPSRISVEPSPIHLSGGRSRQQVAVTGHFADGTTRDLTSSADYQVEPPSLAQATPSGVVTPHAEGSGHLRVIAAGKHIDISLSVSKIDVVRPVSYRLDVAALLSKAGCNMGACHGNLNGKGGFRLSLRGDDPTFDLASLTRDASGRRVDRIRPGGEPRRPEADGEAPARGGHAVRPRVARGADAARLDRGGRPDDASTAPRLVRLTVFPADRMIAAPGAAAAARRHGRVRRRTRGAT